MANQYVNKVVYGNTTLIDLTADTITGASDADKILSGYTAHGADGSLVTGTCTYDADTSGATATQAEVLVGKTFGKAGSILTGTMPNNGGNGGTISTLNGDYTIPQGYADGSGKVAIDSTEKAKVIASNIKAGVQILGVTGTYTGEGVTAQAKTATPYTTAQTILPDDNYDYLSQVTVNAIKYIETDNAAGGKTVTIGDVA